VNRGERISIVDLGMRHRRPNLNAPWIRPSAHSEMTVFFDTWNNAPNWAGVSTTAASFAT